MDLDAGETFCFRFTQFGDNIKTSWQQLQVEKDFCDVTLACKDGQIPTHKIIISHSSPVLKNILNQNSNQNPVIYITSVKFKYLEKLVRFMYQGEVTVAEEDLRNFLDVAEDLKVKGLSEENGELFIPSEEHPSITEEAPPGNTNEKLHKNLDGELPKQEQQNYLDPSPKRKCNTQECTKLINNASVSTADAASSDVENDVFKENILQSLEPEKYAPFNMEKEKYNAQNLIIVPERQFSCNMCNKRYTERGNLTKHKASVHEGVRYPCSQCDVTPFNRLDNLRQHKDRAHNGVRYPCDQCDVSPFSQANNLKRHKASAHEGVRYPCDQCDVAPFTQRSTLTKHKASTHEGVRYPCYECDVAPFNQAHNLRRHKVSAHEGVRYPCDQCNVAPFTQRSTLTKHKASVHEGVRYACDQCDVAPFNFSHGLRHHKASVHEGIRYSCKTCDYKATQKSKLKQHTKKYHNI